MSEMSGGSTAVDLKSGPGAIYYLKRSFAWIVGIASSILMGGNVLILAILTSVIVGPIFWFAYQFVAILPETAPVKAALADDAVFLAFLYFFSQSASYNEVWTILTPILFAVSAGSSLDTGLRTVSIFLFTVFFCAFIASEFVGSYFKIDGDFARMVENAAAGKYQIDFTKFETYAADVGKMCISAVAIALGISLVKK